MLRLNSDASSLTFSSFNLARSTAETTVRTHSSERKVDPLELVLALSYGIAYNAVIFITISDININIFNTSWSGKF